MAFANVVSPSVTSRIRSSEWLICLAMSRMSCTSVSCWKRLVSRTSNQICRTNRPQRAESRQHEHRQ